MNGVLRNIRYDWPLHLVLLITALLPDNIFFLRLRGGLVSVFLGECGPNLRVGRAVSFYNPSRVSLGRDVYIAHGCRFIAGASISVGDEVLFGPYCVVVSSGHTFLGESFRFGPSRDLPVVIGRGCWVAAHVTVAEGAVIGDAAIVAANSCVTGDVPGGAVVAGTPARLLQRVEDR